MFVGALENAAATGAGKNMAASVSPIDGKSVGRSVEEQRLREELAGFYRAAAFYGWDDLTSTHISVRLPGDEHHFLLNPFDLMFEEVTASSLLKIDLNGNLVEPSESRVNKAGFTIHSAIHAARADAMCVVHFHTVDGVAVGAQPRGLLPISAHALFLTGRVGYHEYEGVVDSSAEGPRILGALEDNVALFLRNHGTLAIGSTIAEAFYNIFTLEKACKIQTAALAGTDGLIEVDDAIARHMQGQIGRSFQSLYDMSWAAVLRMLDRRDPSFRT